MTLKTTNLLGTAVLTDVDSVLTKVKDKWYSVPLSKISNYITTPLNITGANTTPVTGSEMISATADSDFSSDTGNWTGTNWVIAAGVATHTAGANAFTLSNSALLSAPASERIYKVTFTVVTTTVGVLTPTFGGSGINSGFGIVSAGTTGKVGGMTGTVTETQIIYASATTLLTFTPDASWEGTIDNVSITQITPASAPQVIRNSDGTIAFEIRTGGSSALNTFIGFNAGPVATTSSARSTGVGRYALSSLTTGASNTAFGSQAGASLTTSGQNVAIGERALASYSAGAGATQNIAVGAQTMRDLRSGGNNVAIGNNVMRSTVDSGSDNILVGIGIGYSGVLFGARNVVMSSWGSSQTAITGNNNTALGYYAGIGITGSYNTLIGNSTTIAVVSDTNSIVIGSGAVGLGSNTVVLGNTSIIQTTLRGNVNFTAAILDKGTVTQAGAITTAVTINKSAGVITTVASTLGAGSNAAFIVNNSFCLATSVIQLCEDDVLTAGWAKANVQNIIPGSFEINITNIHALNAFNNTINIHFIIV